MAHILEGRLKLATKEADGEKALNRWLNPLFKRKFRSWPIWSNGLRLPKGLETLLSVGWECWRAS